MKPTIQYSDFEKLDLRVGKIIEASAPDWSEKLLEFKVDYSNLKGFLPEMFGLLFVFF